MLLLIFLSNYARADEVILTNGDKLTGKIIEIKEGVLTLETNYSEPIKITYESVQKMNSSTRVELHLKTVRYLRAKLQLTAMDSLLLMRNQEENR
jgi:preprotein translocase subunit YajC